jgi:hypothetical protein
MNYTNPRTPASFSGLAKFKQNNKLQNYGPIKELDSYILHKQTDIVFPRQKTQLENVNDQWQADLVDTRNKLHEQYLLVVVDFFSRYAIVRVLKDKSAKETASAFESILQSHSPPKVFYTYSGNEFLGECNEV